MIKRELAAEVAACAKQFSVVVIVGPRQSGKTTLAKELFPNYRYVLLEDPDTHARIAADPRGFLTDIQSASGVIIDEFQQLPELLSYLQGVVDANPRPGFFILTGSQNFLMMAQVSQTLVGRAGILQLLPLSLTEVQPPGNVAQTMFNGLYPAPYQHPNNATRWARNYVSLYLERDARMLVNIKDLHIFQVFLRLCAGRIGNILNISSLANDCGISSATAKQWLSILETCFIITLVQPYYKNFSKRLIKSPKLYFIDTAIAVALLGIETPEQLPTHPLYGALFENLIIMELIKTRSNAGKANNVYFWRDAQGHEVDALLEFHDHMRAVEIKSTQTVTKGLLKSLMQWEQLAHEYITFKSFLVHGGNDNDTWIDTELVSWRTCSKINA
jgi:predicted AAA+ superfamily ATPase